MNIKFIGISGGTGAGKSTLCTSLQNKYPDRIGLIQLDDYFKPPIEAPKIGDIVNFDHPESLYLDKLINDLIELSKGNSVIVNTKNEKLNPEYKNTNKRIPVEFSPKPIMLVEGFLVLHDEKIREMLTTSIWLEIDHNKRWSRRIEFKNEEYEKKVLIPMHQEYAEPTKQYAQHIIDVTSLNKEQVLEKIEDILANIIK